MGADGRQHRPPPDRVMAQRGLDTLADLGDRHVIWAFCNACDRSTRLSTHQLVAVYGADFTISELKGRLSCRNCGDRPREIRIVASKRCRMTITYR